VIQWITSPGVRGIGEKTAAQLLQRFGSLEELYQRLHEVEKPALRERLEQHRTEAFLSRELVRLRTDAPVEFHPEDFARRPVQLEELSTLLDSLALRTVRERLTELCPRTAAPPARFRSRALFDRAHPHQLARHNLRKLCAELRSAPRLGIEPELSDANPWRAELLGIALATEPGRTYFIPISPGGELLSPQPTLFAAGGHGGGFPAEWVLQQLKPLLESPTLPKYGHNLKPFALLLKRYGIELQPIGFDTMLASYVLNPDEQHTLQALAHKWLSVQLSSPPEGAAEREGSASRLELILRLCARLSQELHTQGLWQLAEQLEFPLVEVLAQMEYNGIAVDVTVLRELGEQFRAQLEQLRQRIYAEAGTEFNIDSPKQLGEVLFERLHLPVLKKTKTGYSTDVSVPLRACPQLSHRGAHPGVSPIGEAAVHLHRSAAGTHQSAHWAHPHHVQPSRHQHGAPLLEQPQPAEHSGSRRARARNPPRLHRPVSRYRAPLRRLFADRAAHHGVHERRPLDW
jgi:DNA polymerase-1